MLPRIVLHKKNGHHKKPESPSSLGELMRDVHAGGKAAAGSTFELLKFASVVRTENRRSLLHQAVRYVDAQQSALSTLLARTEAALERGELAEIRATLQSLQAQASEATRLFARLLASAEPRSADHSIVAVGDLIATVAERVQTATGVSVDTRVDSEIASIIGNSVRLERALTTLAQSLVDGRPLTIDVVQADGVIQGEMIVRIIVAGGRPLPSVVAALGDSVPLASPTEQDLDLHAARHVVAEHGGAVSLTQDEHGDGTIRIELPEL